MRVTLALVIAGIVAAATMDPMHADQAASYSRADRLVTALAGALKDPDPKVRRHAADTLTNLRDPAAVSALIEALDADPQAEVRRRAARALGQIGDRTAINYLSAALADPDPSVRGAAARALGAIGMKASSK